MQEKVAQQSGDSHSDGSAAVSSANPQRDQPERAGSGQSALSLLQLERDYLLTKLTRLEALDRQVNKLSFELGARERAHFTLDADLIARTQETDAMAIQLARAEGRAQQAQEEAVRLNADVRNLAALKEQLNQQYQAILLSPAWRATGPLRRAAASLSPRQRAMMRRLLKMAYWAATPQRMPARVRFLMARRDMQRQAALGHAYGAAPQPVPAQAAPVAAPQVVAREAISWFYIGDTLEWLNAHDQLTGVGKVTSELFAASYDPQSGQHARPCVMSDAPNDGSGLVAASYADTIEFLATKLGKPELVAALRHDDRKAPAQLAQAPQPGDHVLFTGVVWTPHYKQLFERLAARRIGVNVFLYDIIPLEHPDLVGDAHYQMFVSWLETTLMVAQTIFVSSRSILDKVVRWATLAGVPVNAAIVPVDFGANEVEAFATPERLSRAAATEAVDLASFVLSVGTIDKRKNQALLARLWGRLVAELGAERVPQLVLVGRDDVKLSTLNEDVAALVASSKIVVLQGLSDAELIGLYRTCLFTAFPSLSEGYGLPVAESLKHGKVCVSSDLECIREHAADFPWYFEPHDEEAAYRLLRAAIEGDGERAAAEARIAQQYRSHTWRETYDTISTAVALKTPSVRSDMKPFERPSFPGAAPVDVASTLAKAGKWCSTDAPDVSMLIINWNAGPLTLECIRQIWANTEGLRYEIVIVDNGSSEQHLAPLRHLGAGIQVLELGKNRFFGEANNIAAEAATGRYLCLQNNDAFVQPGWLTALIGEFERDSTVGAAGPLFLFPDQSIQEAGAVIDANGYPIRFGRGQSQSQTEFLKPLSVDYISAANLIVPRDLFMQVGGFDLQYEPAYYEDVDLCFKIRAMGRSIRYIPEAKVIHIEGSSANHNPEAEARRNALGDLNRDKFVSRWGAFLKSRETINLERVRKCFMPPVHSGRTPLAQRPAPARTAVIYTPYALTPGGGERYILTMASVLAAQYTVTVVTPHPYSLLRLRNLECEFDIDLSACRLATSAQFLDAPPPDLMITMGNHIVPPTPPRGAANLFLCQFPFRMPDADQAVPGWLDGYRTILAYSEYSKAHIFAALSASQLPQLPIEVLHPPVQVVRGDALIKKRQILSVGRFFIGAHSKRHDLLLTAFRTLYERVGGDIELHLAGSSVPEPAHMDYLNRLRKMAEGLPVKFHVNVAPEDLAALYRDSAIYWHGAGLDSDLTEHPETAEHFGMSIVEAMSAGCVPLSFNSGGPREIIRDGVDGFLYGSLGGLVTLTQQLLADNRRDMRESVGQRAALRAADFSVTRFVDRVQQLVDKAVSAVSAG